MLKRIFRSYAMVVLALCCGGCDGAAQEVANEYPRVWPIWIVEDDLRETIYDRKDLERDRKVGKMLVIPLYRYYQHGGGTDFLAIAHPFVYQQGEDIEGRLSSFGQRDKLRRLVFWVPGYFPDGMGRTFPWLSTINGKRMIVVELQRCLGSQERQINDALKTLILGEDFVIEKKIWPEPPPASSLNESRIAAERYDVPRLVRSMEYNGRFDPHGVALRIHVLWSFTPGTQIANRLSAEEKRTVAAFAEEVTKGCTF